MPGDLKSRLRLHEQFPSQVEEEKHDFVVYLPPMYDEQPDRRFPVLYMQDGQNLFDPETCFTKGNYWHMGETADHLIGTGEIEPLIIVGIYNTGEHRIDEYTPVEDKRLGGGQADAYGQMLTEELKIFVDHTYRTLPGKENCGLGGSSLGGLVTLVSGLALHLDVQPLGRDVAVGVVAQSRHPEDGGEDSTQAGTQDLARHRYQRRPARATRCSGTEDFAGEKGLGGRARPVIHGSP